MFLLLMIKIHMWRLYFYTFNCNDWKLWKHKSTWLVGTHYGWLNSSSTSIMLSGWEIDANLNSAVLLLIVLCIIFQCTDLSAFHDLVSTAIDKVQYCIL